MNICGDLFVCGERNNVARLSFFAALLWVGVSLPSRADVTITCDSQVLADNGSKAPGEEYVFFGSTPPSPGPDGKAASATSLKNFSVSSSTDGNFHIVSASDWSVPLATVVPPGATSPIMTGVRYNDAGESNTQQPLFTFKVTSSSVHTFKVWILDDTVGTATNHNASITLAANVDGGGSGSTATHALTISPEFKNEFTEFTVKGAESSDTFTVLVTSDAGGSLRGVAGITFSTTAPKP